MIAILATFVAVVDEDRRSRVVLDFVAFVGFEVSVRIEHCKHRLSISHLVAIHERVERNL